MTAASFDGAADVTFLTSDRVLASSPIERSFGRGVGPGLSARAGLEFADIPVRPYVQLRYAYPVWVGGPFANGPTRYSHLVDIGLGGDLQLQTGSFRHGPGLSGSWFSSHLAMSDSTAADQYVSFSGLRVDLTYRLDLNRTVSVFGGGGYLKPLGYGWGGLHYWTACLGARVVLGEVRW